MQAYQQSGIIVVNKPRGVTSARVVADVKNLLRAKKVGHTGTLDPFAEGVLVCCINDATRLARFLLTGNKTYNAILKLGIETDTQDATGTVTATRAITDCSEPRIASAVNKFKGLIKQGEQKPIKSRYGQIRYSSTTVIDENEPLSGDYDRPCYDGLTIGVP